MSGPQRLLIAHRKSSCLSSFSVPFFFYWCSGPWTTTGIPELLVWLLLGGADDVAPIFRSTGLFSSNLVHFVELIKTILLISWSSKTVYSFHHCCCGHFWQLSELSRTCSGTVQLDFRHLRKLLMTSVNPPPHVWQCPLGLEICTFLLLSQVSIWMRMVWPNISFWHISKSDWRIYVNPIQYKPI